MPEIRDYMIVAAEYRQAVKNLDQATKDMEQAQADVSVKEQLYWKAKRELTIKETELTKSALESLR